MGRGKGEVWSSGYREEEENMIEKRNRNIPLIPELIDDMKESTLFTKFDIHWGYNNICIRKEDQWKATFITPMGLFESTVMFFGFCNASPTFQAFMNHIFADMLPEKWLKIYMDDMEIHTKNNVAVTISYLYHVFFLISVVRRPYFSFAPSHIVTDLYLLAFPDYSLPLLFSL